jgi:hypothetical protein
MSYEFRPTIFTHNPTGNEAFGFVVAETGSQESYEQVDPGMFIKAELDGEERHLLAGVVGIIAEYTKAHETNDARGHDCGAFALACATGEPHFERDYTPPEGNYGYIVPSDRGVYEPLTPDFLQTIHPGDIVLTSAQLERLENAHFIVRVSPQEDPGEPLFASKYGDELSPAIHTLDDIANFYPVVGVARIDEIIALPREANPQSP